MTLDVSPYVVHQAYLQDHRFDKLRSGEGCVQLMDDGSLMALYGKFHGHTDHDKATILRQTSTDGGITWSAPDVFLETPEDSLNLMSISSLKLADGRIAVMYLHKISKEDCRPALIFSSDNGKTWSKPVTAINKVGYYVVNNDRLVQLKSGRLLIPFADHGHTIGVEANNYGKCGCTYSDDGGNTWTTGPTIQVKRENLIDPHNADKEGKRYKIVFGEDTMASQEPGVVELADGRVMLWCRSNCGYCCKAISTDGGATFAPFKPITELAQPMGPQSIKRLPGTNRLIMIYSDKQDVPFESEQFHWRRLLSAAVSDDEGNTWQRLGLIEPETIPTNCYYSICFAHDNVVLTYYEGVMQTDQSGKFVPRNLASLKLKVIKQSFFEQTPTTPTQKA